MKKLRRLSLAFACAALVSTAWAADNSQPQGADTSSQSAELQQLKAQLEQQQKQIEQLRTVLDAQQKLLEKAQTVATPAAPAEPEHKAPNLGEVASTVPIIPRGIAPTAAAASPLPLPQKPEPTDQTSPLQIHIGDATITPVGFMDITNTFRSTNAGTSLQTNFGSFPYNNTIPGRLTEDKWSAENSRVGLRVDAKVHGANVLGYFESDFVGGAGNGANNTQVSSNSFLLRIRQYYVDVRKGFWEVLAGQAWSMLLTNRRGMSPLPADLFYSQVVDVNYTNGLAWGRIPGIRFIGHPSKQIAFGLALENSTQYFGGSGGGGTPTLPTALSTTYNSEVDNGVNNDRTIPNVHPDILAKFAVDPNSHFHFEVGGVESTVKLFNPNTQQYFTKAGGGVTLGANAELVKNFRLVTANYYNDGTGRYIFGAAPNFIVRADGSPSPLHSMSTVSGFEATIKNFAPYIYYGGVYIGRDTALDLNGTTKIGYGYSGSANSQNRSIQEITGGWTHTIWRDGKYGALQWMAQYAYFFRNPWYVAPGAPKNAHETAIWFNLRYVLPGTAPTIAY
jgi:hypothetical protein